MKKLSLLKLLAAGLSIAGAANPAFAAPIAKANNTTNLSVGTSWVGGVVPGVADIATWGSTVTGANSSAIGASMSWSGISIGSPGGLVTIAPTASQTLTLFSSGIDMSAATQNLTITAGFATQGAMAQTWNVATGRTLTTPNFFRGTGSVLTVTGGGTFATSRTNTNNLLGSWGSVLSAGTAANNTAAGYNYATVAGGNIVAYTAATAGSGTGIFGGVTLGTTQTGSANFDISASTFAPANTASTNSANTIRYTGTGANQNGAVAFQLYTNGIMNAGSGTYVINGIDIRHGSGVTNGEIVLNAASSDLNFNTAAINNVSNGTSPNLTAVVTAGGSGTAVVFGSGGSTFAYTGNTTVASGTLFLNGSLAGTFVTGNGVGVGLTGGQQYSNVTVAQGATLAGGGSVGRAAGNLPTGSTGRVGTLTVNGSLAPGDPATSGGIGILTAGNDVTWNGSAGQDWKFQLGTTAPSRDQLLITTDSGSGIFGDFLKGTGSVFNFDFLTSGTAGLTYTLVDWDPTATTGFSASDFSYSGLASGLTGSFAITGSQLDFTTVAVPEPNAALLILTSFGALVFLRRNFRGRLRLN